jgi:hypothetical protein
MRRHFSTFRLNLREIKDILCSPAAALPEQADRVACAEGCEARVSGSGGAWGPKSRRARSRRHRPPTPPPRRTPGRPNRARSGGRRRLRRRRRRRAAAAGAPAARAAAPAASRRRLQGLPARRRRLWTPFAAASASTAPSSTTWWRSSPRASTWRPNRSRKRCGAAHARSPHPPLRFLQRGTLTRAARAAAATRFTLPALQARRGREG